MGKYIYNLYFFIAESSSSSSNKSNKSLGHHVVKESPKRTSAEEVTNFILPGKIIAVLKWNLILGYTLIKSWVFTSKIGYFC